MITSPKYRQMIDGTIAEGAHGHTMPIDNKLTETQISLKGRTTGIITVEALASGGNDYEPFTPAMRIDLANGVFTVITNVASITSLRFTPSVDGDDFTATIVQG